MEIITQDLKFSEYNHALYIKDKKITCNDNEIICFMITNKNLSTKNETQCEDVEIKKLKDKTIIGYKEFNIFFENGEQISFTIYTQKQLEETLNKFKKITQKIKPLMYDIFVDQEPMVINSDNYCYIKKECIKKLTLKNGQQNIESDYYVDSSLLNTEQNHRSMIHFKFLELDIGFKKIKLNMYLKKTFQYNEFHAPGLISLKQKIKRML